MSNTIISAYQFFEGLRAEIVRQAQLINAQNIDGTLQDGFCIANIEDGWVRYKGFSWGFVMHDEPLCIDMSFGPDWPFVGYRIVLNAIANGSGLQWVGDSPSMTFTSAEQLARFGLLKLASKAKDEDYFPGVVAPAADAAEAIRQS